MSAHRQSAGLDLSAEITSVTRGRHFLRATLGEWAADELIDDAELCLSELLTNAVLHARTQIRLEVELDGDLTVRVRDDDRHAIVASPASARTHEHESGRGLHIIETLSARWGVAALPDGKAVWFVLQPRTDDGTPGRLLSFERPERPGHYRASDANQPDGGYLSADMRAPGFAG